MDKELKDALTYVAGTIFGVATFIGVLYSFVTKNLWNILFSVLFLAIITWLSYLTFRINNKRRRGNEKNEKI